MIHIFISRMAGAASCAFLLLTSACWPLEVMTDNGRFEEAANNDTNCPAGWYPPDGVGIQWTNAPDKDGAHGKAIRMDTRVSEKDMVAQWQKRRMQLWNIPLPAEKPIGLYGLSLYSKPLAVVTGFPYRLTFDFKGPAQGATVWVNGYSAGHQKLRFQTRATVSSICN